MKKTLSVAALAALVCLPTAALAGGGYDRVEALEKKMTEMQRAFQAQMQQMQRELEALRSENARLRQAPAPAADLAPLKADIEALKAKDEAISQEVAAVKEAKPAEGADWTKKITLGGMVRMRGYNLQNVWTHDDSKDFDNWDVFRLKASLWAKAAISDDVTGFVKLTDQTYGEGVGTGDNLDNKIFLDNAYINVRNLLGLPVEATIGRQNLIYGTGFVILDGQSQFASTSIYFDGVKLRWHITDKMMLDGLYMKDQENSRGNNANGNSGDDITLSGAYFTAKACPVVGQSELYVLNRSDEGLKKDIWMYGLRISNKLDNGFDYSAEAAIQRGDAMANVDQDAWGTKLNAGFTFKDLAMAPRLYLGYAFMSGDDVNSADNEQWDVFYGGWPQFGDLLAWRYVNIGGGNTLNNVYAYNKLSTVGGEAPYGNLQLGTIGAQAKLLPNLSADLSYTMLSFDEVAAGMDDDFGDYYQAKLKYQYNKNLSFSLYGAALNPAGSTFSPGDPATELFWETMVKF